MLNAISIGMYEYSVLRAIQALKKEAYGSAIERFLSERLDNTKIHAQVYKALSRLKERDFISSKAVEINNFARIVFALKPEGIKIVKDINTYLGSLEHQ